MKNNDKETIKQDINFLENPLWAPKERNKETIYEIKDKNGYKYESIRGIPSKVDIMILYYLLLKSQENRFQERIDTSFYKIMKGCNMQTTNERKDRIIESLARWIRVTISFQGLFYDKKEYKTAEFSIINDYWVSNDKKNVIVNFNENWIKTIQQSNFFKYISFNEMKYMKSPIAIRLYEILSKSFYKRNEWQIGVKKLSEKIPLNESYYSTIKRKIESAVNTINRKTDLNIKVYTEKTKRNDGIFVFKKIQKSMIDIMKESQNGIPDNMPEMINYDDFIKNIDDTELQELKNKFIENEINNNDFLKKRYKKDGFQNKTIQNTFISFVKRQKNDQNIKLDNELFEMKSKKEREKL